MKLSLTEPRFSAAREIARLDAERDFERIYYLSQCYDFPFETLHAAEFGLFKAYCVPELARLLVSTGELYGRPQSRYDNTVYSILGLVEYGLDSPKSHAIARHMNRMHNRYGIAAKHFRYTLAATALEPIYFNERYGWRPFHANERLAYFYFWRAVARLMNTEYFASFGDAERYYRDYEASEFAYSPEGQFLAETNVRLFVSWFPKSLSPVMRVAAHTLLGPTARSAVGLPEPHPAVRAAVETAMRARARALALRPSPTRPTLIAQEPLRTFPEGFDVARLRDFESNGSGNRGRHAPVPGARAPAPSAEPPQGADPPAQPAAPPESVSEPQRAARGAGGGGDRPPAAGRSRDLVAQSRDVAARARLWGATTFILSMATIDALRTGRRLSHVVGVAGRGTVRVVEQPTFPAHDFFAPGHLFACRLRHANATYADDAMLQVRGVALKFDDTDYAAPLDLEMNTGETAVFWTLAKFMRWTAMRIRMIRSSGPRDMSEVLQYFDEHPAALEAARAGVRRTPTSFTQLYYYSGFPTYFRARDGVLRYAKFRLIPSDRGPESGLPQGSDYDQVWLAEDRLPGDTRPQDYLRLEWAERVEREGASYLLQLQLHDALAGESVEVLNSLRPWSEETSPWHDVATVTVNQVLSEDEARRLHFSIGHQPPSLGLIPARSVDDYNSVNYARSRMSLAKHARVFASRYRSQTAPEPVAES